jgi:HEAT repeat protein
MESSNSTSSGVNRKGEIVFSNSSLLRAGRACSLIVLLGLGTMSAQDATQKSWGILKQAASDSNEQKRAQAISVLGLIHNNPEAQALALNALTTDDKPEVRAAGADALGSMQSTAAIPELKKAIKSDQDAGVVVSAAHALHELKDPSAYEVYYAILSGEKKSGQGLGAEQKKMLNDPKKMAQFGFEAGIGFIPFAGLGLGTVKAFTKDDVSPVRAAAAKILAADSDPRSGEILVKAASDKSWIVRASALDAIAHRGDPKLAAQIVPQLDDEKDVVRYVAAAAIIQLSGNPAAKR